MRDGGLCGACWQLKLLIAPVSRSLLISTKQLTSNKVGSVPFQTSSPQLMRSLK
jgi:hypothetical protein